MNSSLVWFIRVRREPFVLVSKVTSKSKSKPRSIGN